MWCIKISYTVCSLRINALLHTLYRSPTDPQLLYCKAINKYTVQYNAWSRILIIIPWQSEALDIELLVVMFSSAAFNILISSALALESSSGSVKTSHQIFPQLKQQ